MRTYGKMNALARSHFLCSCFRSGDQGMLLPQVYPKWAQVACAFHVAGNDNDDAYLGQRVIKRMLANTESAAEIQ